MCGETTHYTFYPFWQVHTPVPYILLRDMQGEIKQHLDFDAIISEFFLCVTSYFLLVSGESLWDFLVNPLVNTKKYLILFYVKEIMSLYSCQTLFFLRNRFVWGYFIFHITFLILGLVSIPFYVFVYMESRLISLRWSLYVFCDVFH